MMKYLDLLLTIQTLRIHLLNANNKSYQLERENSHLKEQLERVCSWLEVPMNTNWDSWQLRQLLDNKLKQERLIH